MPDSFSFNLLGGEALVCGNRATTPKAPYTVLCTPQLGLPDQFLRDWFIQSLVPLVGGPAATLLKQLMEGEKREDFAPFLQAVCQFRESLLPPEGKK